MIDADDGLGSGLDPGACYQAMRARDGRFDGRFFTCVTTTGIYCRPICPAPAPRRANCRFVPSAAAAQAAGFRPCLRCRPELSPDVAAWRGTHATVARAMALIAAGALDGDDGVEPLAERLGIGERQLRRLFDQHLGASPVAVAQTRRVLFAKQLVQDTALPLADVALAAGFGSVRRFNAVFRALFNRPPGALRRGRDRAPSTVSLRLGHRAPYDWPAMLGFLAARAVPGVERVDLGHGPGHGPGVRDGGRYARTIQIDGHAGALEVRRDGEALVATLRIGCVTALPAVVARLRRVLDLDADVQTIGAHLARDAALAPLVAARPGLRTPGGWDGFEQAARAVLGQQVTVAAARQLAGKLVAIAGPSVDESVTGDPALTRLFPSPAQVQAADLSGLGMPAARRATLVSLAAATVADRALFEASSSLDAAVARLRALDGFGEWTAQYIALRALGHADAFPAGDVALRRSPVVAREGRLTEKQLLARAEGWRPWRGYAAQHLWTAEAATADVAPAEAALEGRHL